MTLTEDIEAKIKHAFDVFHDKQIDDRELERLLRIDIKEVVDGLVQQLQEMKYVEDAKGKYFEGFDQAIDLVLKKVCVLGAKESKRDG